MYLLSCDGLICDIESYLPFDVSVGVTDRLVNEGFYSDGRSSLLRLRPSLEDINNRLQEENSREGVYRYGSVV